ncbi:MAG: desulfoferrodoxin family protein [Ruminococcus bromii]|nr:desulfoferrodoxin family protein [Ruminococcus bromii]
MDYKFYLCKHCGNIITMVKDCGVPVVCCGEKMHELVPCSTQAAVEKHMPVYKIDGNNVFVTVGENAHPMQEEHYIQWVALVSKQGLQVKNLKPDQNPDVCFALLDGDEVEAVYAYCNLHGLWKV